jgi:hypothetical protein
MTILKPQLCTWLYVAWQSSATKTAMIKKCWEKCGLLQALEAVFQILAMEANATTSLFSTDHSKVEIDDDQEEVEVDLKETIEEVLQQCLTDRITSHIQNKGVNSHAKLRNLVRRKMLN